MYILVQVYINPKLGMGLRKGLLARYLRQRFANIYDDVVDKNLQLVLLGHIACTDVSEGHKYIV